MKWPQARLRDVLWVTLPVSAIALIVSLGWLDEGAQAVAIGVLGTILGTMLGVVMESYLRERGEILLSITERTLEHHGGGVEIMMFTLRAFNERDQATALFDPEFHCGSLQLPVTSPGGDGGISVIDLPARAAEEVECWVVMNQHGQADTFVRENEQRAEVRLRDPVGKVLAVALQIPDRSAK